LKGGVALSQDHQSFLRFSLEESVWFQKGQEVAELVSISLDPNITIIENEQYVTIKGSLELTGEYTRNEGDAAEENLEEIKASKFVHSVEERDEGLCEFLHRFPVDITIPNNRIQSVYDIDVTVDSFDYAVPERSCLKLSAELTISGLYGEQQNVPYDEEDREPESIAEQEVSEQPQLEEDTEIPAAQAEVEPELEPLYRAGQSDVVNEDQFFNQNFIFSNPVESALDEQEEDSELYEPSESFSAEAKKQQNPSDGPGELQWGTPLGQQNEPFSKVPEFSFTAKRSENEAQQAEDVAVSEAVDIQPGHGSMEHEEVMESPESSSESSPVSEQTFLKNKKASKKKSMSIAEFLGKRSEHEQQAKLKVCIVQQGETLDSLSERYELSITQILRVNHLEATQDVYEGQVLYIPEHSSGK
jgi:stage VI sporulation protein D